MTPSTGTDVCRPTLQGRTGLSSFTRSTLSWPTLGPAFPSVRGLFCVEQRADANGKPRRFGGTGAFGPGNSQGAGGTGFPESRLLNAISIGGVSPPSLTILLPPPWSAAALIASLRYWYNITGARIRRLRQNGHLQSRQDRLDNRRRNRSAPSRLQHHRRKWPTTRDLLV